MRKDLETKSIATRVIAANRSTTRTATLLVMGAIVASSAVVMTIIFTRPTHVNSSGALVDTNDQVVSTSKAMGQMPVERIAELGKEYDYNKIESVKVGMTNPETGQEEVLGFRTLGYHWYNSTDIDFFLEGSMTLHVSMGLKVLAPTVRNAWGATPVAHRRQMLAFIPVMIFCVVAYAVTGGVLAYKMYVD